MGYHVVMILWALLLIRYSKTPTPPQQSGCAQILSTYSYAYLINPLGGPLTSNVLLGAETWVELWDSRGCTCEVRRASFVAYPSTDGVSAAHVQAPSGCRKVSNLPSSGRHSGA
ncbi:hypothetical protein EDD16DRAFT_736064 [Pisolithus croceorrhizus]|nr:hypothetical protein EDD16DRAFT_736064 [Pisolithus croceorrhizus]